MRKPAQILKSSTGSLLTGENLHYLEEMRARFEADPMAVDSSWHLALTLLGGSDERADTAFVRFETVRDRVRRRGHTVAHLNPLDGQPTAEGVRDAARTLVGPQTDVPSLNRLSALYCGGLGVETEHLDDERLRDWIYDTVEDYQMESADLPSFARVILAASEFERCMATKFTAKKRFGAEGAEGVVLLLRRVLWRLAGQGVKTAVIGTMHRGRLNLLSNALGRPLTLILAEFAGKHPFADGSAADVPYHLGWKGDVELCDGRHIVADMLPNPSHLEAVNSIALGKTRAMQDAGSTRAAAAIILHTDAAVVAQGLVAENIQLARLRGFSTGGTIHIVVNNQIGFTTEPGEARSSRYCTGAWKATDTLILHVNGEDVGSIIKAADIATDYRAEHRRDSVIDFICYRRNGHNEIDEPRFTRPVQYRQIDAHPPFADSLLDDLIDQGVLTRETTERWRAEYAARFLSAYSEAGQLALSDRTPARDAHHGLRQAGSNEPASGLRADTLKLIIRSLSTPPSGLTIDPRLDRIVRARADAFAKGVSWPLAEALAFASLDLEGKAIRLTGQDVVRGAFSHRHFEVSDAKSGDRAAIIGRGDMTYPGFQVCNSPLSEYAVLGFEYGYSLARPDGLVIWEAQFGDFANGAQIVIDQFISAGKEKWRLESALTLLLPHGLEGQGPEHSSARIERFLQLCQPDNFDVALPSTPANYFHLLRRQARREDARPLVIFSAKALLRHPSAVSPIAEFAQDTAFRPVITNQRKSSADIRHVVFCSGKIAYDLERGLGGRPIEDTAIVRIERLAPFPHDELLNVAQRWPQAKGVFLQEEPINMGAWDYVSARLENVLREAGWEDPRIRIVARPASGSPAGGFHVWHERDQQQLIEAALSAGSNARESAPPEAARRSRRRQ